MQLHTLTMTVALTIVTAVGMQPAARSFNFRTPTHPTLSEVTASQTRVSQATKATRFKVRIENISQTNGFTASNGTQWTLDFSPGVWLIHGSPNPLFTTGQADRGQGLEAIAEDGDPTTLSRSLQRGSGVVASGVFNTAVGASKVGGIRPGQAFEFTVSAVPGQALSLATMFGQSNDWFYAPQGAGIALFDTSNQPIRGDVTSQIVLWNDGTEVDEEPGIGPNQGPRQKAPNTGVDEHGVVQAVTDTAPYAQTGQVMRVTITPES